MKLKLFASFVFVIVSISLLSGVVYAQQLQSINFAPRATVPVTCSGGSNSGTIYFDSNTGGLLRCNGSSWDAVGGAGGAGTVTSVGLSFPAQFTISGSPVTGSGTLTGSWASQTANYVLAAPNGVAGIPTFRAVVAADLPASVSFLGTAIEKGELANSGTLGFTWADSEVSDVLSINNGVLYALTSGNVGIGTTGPNLAGFTAPVLTILSSGQTGLELVSTRVDGDALSLAGIEGRFNTNSAGHERVAHIAFQSDGTTANQRGGRIQFQTKADAATALTARMTIAQGGNVGIGTTAPQNLLDINGTSGKGIRFSGTNPFIESTSYLTLSANVNDLVFNTAGSERMRILSTGNVGIGTASPSNTLHLYRNGSTPVLQLYSDRSAGSASPAQLMENRILFGGVNNQGWSTTNGAGIDFHTNYPAETSTGRLNFWAYPNTSASPVLTVWNGNVGIGVTAPTVKLDIAQNAAIKVGNAYLSSGGDYTHLANNEWYNGTAWTTNGLAGVLYQQSGQTNVWYTHDAAGVHTERMRLDPSGNVTATSFLYASDENLKKDIRNLENSIEKISSLQGVSFTWKDTGKQSVGLIAQEVEKVYPELVSINAATGLKSLNYGALIAPLIEAVKNQQEEIEKQQEEINALKELLKQQNGL